MTQETANTWGELAFFSLVRSPFFLSSLALHLLLFYVLAMVSLSVKTDEVAIPISLIEFGEGTSRDKSIGPGQGPGGPRTQPKRGIPEIPRQSSGKLAEGSPESAVPSKESTPAPEAAPALPQPKALADARLRPFAVKESSPDSLVQLPMKDAPTNFPAINTEAVARASSATKGAGEGEGIRALKEGMQIPGALKGGGSGVGPYGVAGGTRDGKGIAGGGTGTGLGGGSSSGLRGARSGDLSQYLKLIEKRVFSVWKYPDEVTGVQKVSVRFTLDRAGKLTQAEVLDSSDSRINASALEAMKRASPFPPIPENMKELAGEPLVIRFTVAISVRG
jgi:TonB family protein